MPKRMPKHRQLEYLFEEGVGVTEPTDMDSRNCCPSGWFGVWDEDNGHIAYFKYGEDAYAFRLSLITMRQQGERIGGRYRKKS